MDEPGGQVDAATGAERRALASDQKLSPALEDVDHLVVEVEVIGRAPGWDEADELGRRRTAELGPGTEHELPARCRRPLLLGSQIPDRERRRGRRRIVHEHREHADAPAAPPGASSEEHRRSRSERVTLASHLELARAAEDVQDLVRRPGLLLTRELDHTLGEQAVRVQATVGPVLCVDRVLHRP